MSNVAIIGAGHAGVEAAFTLAKAGVKVTLYSNETSLPYFRPRLIAVAFGQSEPAAIAMKPSAAYEEAGITIAHEAVTTFDATARTVNGCAYDGVIMAQGSTPFRPPFKGEGAEKVATLWTMADALAIRERAQPGTTLAIIGGGVLGLEAALRAVMAGMQVTVIEVAPVLLGGCLGTGGEATLRAALEAKGITLKVGCAVAEIATDGVVLADGTKVAAEVILCSAGARPNTQLAATAGLSVGMGVTVQPDLSIASKVYAAGDQARLPVGRPVCAVMRAMRMGALAARNLLADLQGEPCQPWVEPVLPLFMKVESVEFHTAGICWEADVVEERVDDGTNPLIWKSVLKRGDAIIGLRWVGTRAGFADWEKQLVR